MCYLPREIIRIQKLAYKLADICFKTCAGKDQDWNPKSVWKRSNIFSPRNASHEKPALLKKRKKKKKNLRLKNIYTHTHITDTSFTLVSLYFSRSVVPKRYTVLESLMIYKLNFIFPTMEIFSQLRAQQIVTHTLFRCLFLHLYISLSNAALQTLNWLCTWHCSSIIYCHTDMLSVLYFIHIWFTVAAFYITTYTIV